MKRIIYTILALAAVAACKNRSQEKAPEEAAEPERILIETVAPRDTAIAVKNAKALPEEPVFDIVTNMGTIRVKLYKDTPRHRDNFEKLALSGYYDSLLFHRVVPGFVIQAGDPFTRDTAKVDLYGQGGPDYTIPAEMRDSAGIALHRHKKGALAAARRGDVANPFKESSGSQFYLVVNPDACIHLDGEYTVFGETIAGLNVIDRIAGVKTDRLDRPLREVRIRSIRPNEKMNKKAASGTELAEKDAE